ncbi:hypothetical protein PIB30_054798 [Stylosanthes scabra]|uniref:Uncharacterized protein n=1 Tax=Stylosanthes scabra TaxID=79078 RepID=A0ABU6TIP6_9FABA|nr:hypothetical protein [Stylosanthes scabra]
MVHCHERPLKSRTTETDLVLTFSNKTQVTPVANPSFPLEALRLKSIGDLLQAERIDDAEFLDSRDMLTKKGEELKKLAIIVEDIEKNMINCALFNQHANGILPYLDESRQEPLIVVLHYYPGMVHINPELDEVVAFRERKWVGAILSRAPTLWQIWILSVMIMLMWLLERILSPQRSREKRHVNEQMGTSSGADESEFEGQLSTNKFSQRGGKKGFR